MRFGPLFTNTGFYFVRNTPKTLYMQERLIRAAGEIDYTASHQATFIRHLVETHYLYNLPILILDDRDFPSGQMYHHQKEYVNEVKLHSKIPYVWHMCWTDNREQKVSYFKDIGMWFLQTADYHEGLCENGPKLLEWTTTHQDSSRIVTACCTKGDYWNYKIEKKDQN